MNTEGLPDAGGKHRWPLPEGVIGRASFSLDGHYRYVLWREWEPEAPYLAFVGLNPSTAEANVDDPTVRRCWSWAQQWGYGSMAMLNLYAYRATDPGALKEIADPIGGQNDAYLRALASDAALVIVGWGVPRDHERHSDVLVVLRAASKHREVWCLGTTKDGYPRHPLYLKRDVTPERYLPQ